VRELFTDGYKVLSAVVKTRDAVVRNYAASESGEDCRSEGESHDGKVGFLF
jgi:hypothetical protein